MQHRKHMSRDHHPPLRDVTADTESIASYIVACWTVFTELLPGNALIRSVILSHRFKLLITNMQLHFSFCHLFLQFYLHFVHINTISLITWKRVYVYLRIVSWQEIFCGQGLLVLHPLSKLLENYFISTASPIYFHLPSVYAPRTRI
jgi:thiosulfate reductase cytochrome b subunit